ncbi:MAG TPA: hypothetical protein VGR52_08955 [Stellaceae bacterium]|nr:hypothetical protein [Stellaceae bacterium]
MSYNIVYDASTTFSGWWILFGGVVLSAGFIAIIISDYRSRRDIGFRRIAPWFGLFVTITVSPVLFVSAYFPYRNIETQMSRGGYFVAVGPVQNFKPGELGKGDVAVESFTVDGKKFSYSDSLLEPGFHRTQGEGGPLRSGLVVRITYVREGTKNVITKLEVGRQ